MKTTGLNLLIPDKPDPERDALADAFARSGGLVHRIGRFWEPPAFNPATVRVYGPESFCLVLQQKLGFTLCSPDDDLLLCLPPECLQRRLSLHSLATVQALTYPVFIKPLVPKQFRGAVYPSAASLEVESRGLAGGTQIVTSEIVAFCVEVRCFVLAGKVLDASAYEGMGDVSSAMTFAGDVGRKISLPRVVVVDVGHIAGRGWAVVEFNAAWGAGLNGCDPARVLPAVVAASGPANLLSPA